MGRTPHLGQMMNGFMASQKRKEEYLKKEQRVTANKEKQRALESNNIEKEIQLAMQRKDFVTAAYLDKCQKEQQQNAQSVIAEGTDYDDFN